MKKYAIIFLVLITPFLSNAQAQKDSLNGLLWKIEGNGLATASYLYGTVHMICKEDFLFSNTLTEITRNVNSIYLELDMDEPGMTMKLASLAFMKKKSLKDLLSQVDYSLVSDFVRDSLKMPMMIFNKTKPLMLMSVIYTKILPCSDQESYEQKFVALAKKFKKEIYGLETIEEQMSVFDNIPDSIEAQMIVEMIKTLPTQKMQFAELIKVYKTENLDQISSLMSNSPEWKGYEDIMLVNRNKNWISSMINAMNKGSMIFAVGAGHLPGPNGIISLLRKSGFQVVPVTQKYDEMATIIE
ncbi:MAG: TraB/GumN family protein [Chitinophagaceae bacterium]